MAESESVLSVEAPARASRQRPRREGRALVDILSSQLEALKSYHQAVLQTADVEAIHKMRVTTRRLQASLDLVGSNVKVRRLKKQLRRWRRMLSLVRNYDVFLALIEKEAQARRGAHREQFDLIKTKLEERRARRAAKVRGYLEKIDVDRMAKKLGLVRVAVADKAEAVSSPDVEQALKEPGASEQEASTDKQAATAFSTEGLQLDQSMIAARAADRLEQRIAEFQELAAASHPTTDPAELHQLRIAAKRVRYILELVSSMGYGDAKRSLGWLRTLQDRIGDWHDLHALEEAIIKIVSRRDFMKEHLDESSRMLQAATHLQKKKEGLVSKLFPVRVPRTLVTTSNRMVRAMRRRPRPSAKPATDSD